MSKPIKQILVKEILIIFVYVDKSQIMHKITLVLFIFLATPLFQGCLNNQPETLEGRSNNISRREMQSIVEFFSDDLLEGRAPGTRGAKVAERYLKSMCKFMDFAPGTVDGSYLQPFNLKGFSTKAIKLKANNTELKYLDDVVGVFTEQKEMVDFNAEAVFVGFGIHSDIMEWDDYKDYDVSGKLVIARVNDPGLYNPDIFEGKTLTYFGRWTYRIEEAARRGAAGILLIHTDETAGYNWDVVKNSWSGEELFIQSDIENSLKLRGWIKESSLNRLLKNSNINLKELYGNTVSKSFTPKELGFSVSVSAQNTYREIQTNNVVAVIPGKKKQSIVLSAHIDHLGMGSRSAGDSIYNGAIDNSTAVAAMMLTAKILKEHQANLHYSITILGCNAEESGLLGSKYYMQNTDRENIVANINFESTPVWNKANSVMGIGARFSGFEDIIKQIAENDGLNYSSFSLSNQGLFYRSDQFSFARYGVPSVWISAGEDEVNGERNYTEFWSKNYHTVKDEYSEKWPLEGMRQTIHYALRLIDYINKTQKLPELENNLPFPIEE